MKIRNGFVSNSSSSSFCIVGVAANNDNFSKDLSELRDMLVQEGYDEMEVEEFGTGELLSNIYNTINGKKYETKFGNLEVVDGIEDYSGQTIVGRGITYMKDDETLGQFKQGIYEKLKSIGYLGEPESVRIYIDGGYC